MASIGHYGYPSPLQRERQLQLSRKQELTRNDTLKALASDQVLKSTWDKSEQLENKRAMRMFVEEQRELEMEGSISKAQFERLQRKKQEAQEEKLAEELSRMKQEQVREEKIRQQIRINSIELRELDVKIKSACINKERSAQIAEKQTMKFDEMKRDAEISKEMMEESKRADENERRKEVERHQEQIYYQQDLERQLEDQELRKQNAYEELLKEKLMIDEIVKKIYEEDRSERVMVLKKQQATKEYIEDFNTAREHLKNLERRRMEDENESIRRFAQMQSRRDEDNLAKKTAIEESRAHVQKLLGEEISRQAAEKEELENILLELNLEEDAERERIKERELMELRIRRRLDMQSQRATQMQIQAIRKADEEKEHEQLKRDMLAKFAADDKIEQLNAQRRRMKQMEHKRAVEELMEKRKREFAATKEAELKELRENENFEALRMQIVEEERQKLLQEHVNRLIGYLPKGVIRNEDDLKGLSPEVQEAYQKRVLNPFTDEAFDN